MRPWKPTQVIFENDPEQKWPGARAWELRGPKENTRTLRAALGVMERFYKKDGAAMELSCAGK